MSEVKIYTVVSDELSPPVIGESFCTDMVRHSDYAALEQKLTDMAVQLANAESKCRELASENTGLKGFGKTLSEMHEGLNGSGTGIQGEYEATCQQVALDAAMDAFDEIKTPATDAFLAEVRAQGVEMYADNLDSSADDAERDGFDDAVKFLRSEASGVRLFAAQLRQEAK